MSEYQKWFDEQSEAAQQSHLANQQANMQQDRFWQQYLIMGARNLAIEEERIAEAKDTYPAWFEPASEWDKMP